MKCHCRKVIVFGAIDADGSRSDPVGSLGTVVEVIDHHDWIQVDVDWDNGRSLMLTLPEDTFELVARSSDSNSHKEN